MNKINKSDLTLFINFFYMLYILMIFFSSLNSSRSSPLPCLLTSFSLSESIKQQNHEALNKQKSVKQKIQPQKHAHTKQSILCWPNTPGHGPFPGAWLKYTQLHTWRKLSFPFASGYHSKQRLGQGVGLCVHFPFSTLGFCLV